MSIQTVVVIWLVCACSAAIIANKKGQNTAGFFVAGLAFGVFGVLWAWAVRDLTVPDTRPKSTTQPQQGTLARPMSMHEEWQAAYRTEETDR